MVDISELLLELGLSASVTEEERAIADTALTYAEGAVKRYLKYDPVQRTRTEYYPQQDFGYVNRIGVWETQGDQAYLREQSRLDNSELQIKNIPIRSITELRIDYDGRSGTKSGAFPDSSIQTEGLNFWANYDGTDEDGNKICRDGILRSFGAWPVTPGTIKITYVAGYTDDELHGKSTVVDASPIVSSVLSEAARRVRRAFVWKKNSQIGFVPGPLTGEKLGDYSWKSDNSISTRMFGNMWDLMPETQNNLESFVHWGLGN